jgi:cardiolipin synthase
VSNRANQIRRIRDEHRETYAQHRILTVPNVISIARLVLLMPLFVVTLLVWKSPGWALVVAIVLAASDYLDGFIARKFHQVTILGKALDPVADRISQIVVSASLVLGGYLPAWMALVIVAADLVLVALVIVRGSRPIPVRWIGRIRTGLLMVGLPLVLVVAAFAPSNEIFRLVALLIVGTGVVLHAIADLLYAWSLALNTADKVKDAHPEVD